MLAHVAAPAHTNAAQRRILIVDDDAATRRLYRFLFASSGYAVDEAEDGVEALEKLRVFATPVVITDMNMPRMDGMELVQHIRQHFPAVYTIMVTAFGASDTEKRALRAGAHQYLAKPFEFEELEQHVHSFFDTLPDTSPFPR